MVERTCVICGAVFAAKGLVTTCSLGCKRAKAAETRRRYHAENSEKKRKRARMKRAAEGVQQFIDAKSFIENLKRQIEGK